MLENLDSRWARLQHAYGEASDVPGHLRALTGADRDAAEAALGELWSCLCHQGTVYSASAAAVPFLLEILGQGTAPHLVHIAWLVGGIAHGTGFLTVHRKLKLHRPWPDEAEVLAEEQRVVHACREAVRQGIPVLRRLLDGEDAQLRGRAVYGLSRFATDPDVARALATRAREEGDDQLRVGLSLARTYADGPAPAVPGDHGPVFEKLMELARSGQVPELALFQALELVLTDSLQEASTFASEVMNDAGR